MYGFGVNYNLPLFYPDWGFADLVYFLRIRANVFYDYTAVPYYATNGPGVQSQYRSAGIGNLPGYKMVEPAAAEFWHPLQPSAGSGLCGQGAQPVGVHPAAEYTADIMDYKQSDNSGQIHRKIPLIPRNFLILRASGENDSGP